MSATMYTVGSYLAARLSQIGLRHHFAVAGDFNLVLLDQLLKNKELEQVYCCNELNCGYSAEAYARACGAAAAVVTFSVGGLSAINAIGGAYAENLPVILVSSAPKSNDRANPRNARLVAPAGNCQEAHLCGGLCHFCHRCAPPDRLCDPHGATREEAGLHRNRMQRGCG